MTTFSTILRKARGNATQRRKAAEAAGQMSMFGQPELPLSPAKGTPGAVPAPKPKPTQAAANAGVQAAHASSKARLAAAQERLGGAKAKAADKPPAGFHPAPRSKKGGFTDGHGQYWYPGKGVARAGEHGGSHKQDSLHAEHMKHAERHHEASREHASMADDRHRSVEVRQLHAMARDDHEAAAVFHRGGAMDPSGPVDTIQHGRGVSGRADNKSENADRQERSEHHKALDYHAAQAEKHEAAAKAAKDPHHMRAHQLARGAHDDAAQLHRAGGRVGIGSHKPFAEASDKASAATETADRVDRDRKRAAAGEASKLDKVKAADAARDSEPHTITSVVYGAHDRPVSFASVPSGYSSVGDHPDFKHGTVTYNGPLDTAEAKRLGLREIPTDQRKAAVVQAAVADLSEYAADHLEMANDDPTYFKQMVGHYIDTHNVHMSRDELAPQVEAALKAASTKDPNAAAAEATRNTAPSKLREAAQASVATHQMGRYEHLANEDAPQPGIGEISGLQRSRMSKRALREYDADRHRRSEKHGAARDAYDKAALEAHKQGKTDLHPDAVKVVKEHQSRGRVQAIHDAGRAARNSHRSNKQFGARDAKVGAKVNTMYGEGTVTRASRLSVRVKLSSGGEMKVSRKNLGMPDAEAKSAMFRDLTDDQLGLIARHGADFGERGTMHGKPSWKAEAKVEQQRRAQPAEPAQADLMAVGAKNLADDRAALTADSNPDRRDYAHGWQQHGLGYPREEMSEASLKGYDAAEESQRAAGAGKGHKRGVAGGQAHYNKTHGTEPDKPKGHEPDKPKRGRDALTAAVDERASYHEQQAAAKAKRLAKHPSTTAFSKVAHGDTSFDHKSPDEWEAGHEHVAAHIGRSPALKSFFDSAPAGIAQHTAPKWLAAKHSPAAMKAAADLHALGNDPLESEEKEASRKAIQKTRGYKALERVGLAKHGRIATQDNRRDAAHFALADAAHDQGSRMGELSIHEVLQRPVSRMLGLTHTDIDVATDHEKLPGYKHSYIAGKLRIMFKH
jgi:hypothetical protein